MAEVNDDCSVPKGIKWSPQQFIATLYNPIDQNSTNGGMFLIEIDLHI